MLFNRARVKMAEKEDIKNVPVLSVLRNGRSVKNIFLSGPGGEIREEYEEMPLLMGRHPDCHIILNHPSISRFHLHIFAKPSIHKVTVVDRSSVHGTWVSGTKIETNIPVDIKEGDILMLGASTREYRLQWLSLHEAYEMENPLPPLIEEKEENPQEEICQEVLNDYDEITTHEIPEEYIPFELEKVQLSPVIEDLADTGFLSGPASEPTEAVNGNTASSFLLELMGAHPISYRALPYSESTEPIVKGTPARLLSETVATSMNSKSDPPESEPTGSILRATSSNLHQELSGTGPTSELAPLASESAKSIRKGTPTSLLSRRTKSKSISSLSVQTATTKEKAQPKRKHTPKRALFQNVDFEEVEDNNCESSASDKENCTHDSKLVDIEIGERKDTERVPFQVLLDNNNIRVPHSSPLKPLSTIPDNSSVCGPQHQVQREKAREPRKEWIMVVDIDCLLGEESIKAIRLLQGLRGTRLIIPRIVIRELDCMKRREGLFKRANKQASLVLEWIEECMEKDPLWIHVQSSAEALPVAPTPPITPTSLFGDVGEDLISGFRSYRNSIYSPCSSFMEILTPTSEDHVLSRGGGPCLFGTLKRLSSKN